MQPIFKKINLPAVMTAGFVIGLSLLLPACGSKSSTPSSPGGGGTGNSALTSTMIEAALEDDTAPGGSIGAEVDIASSSGAVTNAAVTLTGSAISAVAVTYVTSVSLPVSISGKLDSISFGVYEKTGWTYTAGQPYTVTASAGGTTYSDSITAVGGIVINVSGSGVASNWTNGYSTSSSNPVNISQFTAKNSSNTTVYSEPAAGVTTYLTSPLAVSASLLSGAATVYMDTGVVKLSAFPGSFTASFIEANSEAATAY